MDPHNNLPEFEKGITTNWGTVISNVVEQLPSVESDSEVSITNDDTDEEEVVFQRNPVIFNKIESPDLFSNCDESKNKETSDSRLLLFQRLTCKAPSRTYIDIDEDFPIFETPFRNIDDAVSKQRDDKKCEHISTVNDSSFITPTLSLQTLNSYDLDDMLSSFSESVGNLHTRPDKGCLISPSLEPEVLMNQLVNLSVDQSSEQRLNKQHLDTKHDLEFRNSEPPLNERQKATNFLISELRCSEPTTIFLDLRSKAATKLYNKFQNKSINENIQNGRINTGTSTSSLGTNSPHSFSKSNIPNLTTKEEIVSDDSEDDFEQWKAMRNRFKSTSCVSMKTTSNKLMTENEKTTFEDVMVKKQSANVQSSNTSLKCLKNFCGNLNDLNNEDTKQELREITMKLVKDRKSKLFDSKMYDKTKSCENTNNNSPHAILHSTSIKANENCLNAETPNGLYASQRLKKPCLCCDNDTQSKMPLTSHGKSTVLFAEEPQTGSSDTTHIFRNKQLISPENKPPQATTMCVQTEESFSTWYNLEDKKKYANEILNISRRDLTTAAENVAEQKKFGENETKIPRQVISSGARHNIVQNQRKQPPLHGSSTLTIKCASVGPAVSFENRTKICKLLENMHKDNKDYLEKKMFPFLYDREATFSNEIDTVPNTVNLQCTPKMVVLTFHMVSPGCIVYNKTTSGRFNPVDQPNNLSLTYSLLISWLLALIPDKLEKPHDPPREDVFTLDCDTDHESDSDLPNGHDDLIPSIIEVPFNVVSLHQAWQEETQTIVTNAVVIPNFFYKPDISGRRKKPKKENAFFQVVWHFLQSNRVQDVCPWYSRPESPIYTLNEIALACSTKPLSTYITISNDPKMLHKALNKKPGFFWKVATPDDQSMISGSSEINQLETTICLLQKDSFSYPLCLMDLVVRLQLSCLDIVGLRLTFVTKKIVQKNILSHGEKNLEEIVPCAAVAIRGKSAIKKVQNIIGPRDPVLARMTDHGSLNAVYGEQLSKRRGDSEVPTEMNVFNCPRGIDRVLQQLVVWFGGRISPNDDILSDCLDSVKTLGLKSPKLKSSSKNKGRGRNISTPKLNSKNSALNSLSANAYLVTWKPSNICLVISSRFPPQFIGDIIAIATDQGFFIEGIKRLHLNERKVAGLNVPSRYAIYFNPQCSMEEELSGEYYEIDNWWQRPVTILLLGRENASIHQSGLIACIQSELIYRLVSSTEQGHLHSVTNQCFHICPHNDAINHIIGPICKFPEIELSSGVTPRSFFSDPELEQVVVLALLGKSMINECGCILQTLLHGEFYLQTDEDSATNLLFDDMGNDNCSEFRGFELLGIKLIPMVSSQHAKELTPFEVGTELWCDSIPMIKDSSALLCVLRRINAFNIIQAVLKIPPLHQIDKSSSYIKNMDRIMSSTPEISYRQIKTFFGEKELFADNRCRPLLKFLPPPMRVAQYTNGYLSRSDGEEGTGDHGVSHSSSSKSSKKRKKRKQKALQNQTSHTEESVLDAMLSWPRPITSVLIIKPDAFPRHVVKILRRLYQEKFSVVAIRMAILSEDQASQVMPTKYEKMLGERSVFTSHMTSSASLVVCVQRINAVRRLVDVAGPIDPREAHKVTTCGNGNWRAEFGIDEFSNAIHVSEKYVAACEEQKLFFPEGLCCKQTLELKMEQIPFVQDYSVMREDKVKGREVGVCDNPNVDLLGTTGMEIQPVCLVLSSPVINCPKSDKKPGLLKMYPPYIDIMEQLLTQGYEICAWHMTCFSVNQAKKLYELMGDKSSNNLQFTVNLLTSGPSFLLYMQRENGLILFDSILGSCLRRYSLLEHAPNILRTQTLKQTHICVKHLFHRLENKRSIIRISHKRALEWQDRNGVTNS